MNLLPYHKIAQTKYEKLGRSDDFILLERVSVTDPLSKDSLVITAGDLNSDSVGIPPGFVIGKTDSINKSPSLPFQTAKIISKVDFSALETVFVSLGLTE